MVGLVMDRLIYALGVLALGSIVALGAMRTLGWLVGMAVKEAQR